MPTDETIYLPFTVEGSSNHLILGKKFCHYFSVIKSINKSSIEDEERENSQDIGTEGAEEMKQKREFHHSKEEEEGEKSLNTFKVNTFNSEGIYDMEHTHKVNEDLSEENQKLFNIRQSKAFNLFERDKKPIQETLASEEEEIQAILEEILKGNPWDNELLSQPQAASTHQEISPLFIQEFKNDWDINPQTTHLHRRIHEPSNYEVKSSKEMDKTPFEGILKKEDDENQPFTPSEQTDQDQLTSEEKEILKLYDAFFNMDNQQGETKNLAQRLELNNFQLPQENTIPSGHMSGILHDNTSNKPIHISRERKVTRNTKIREFSIRNQNNEHTTRNKIEVNLRLTYSNHQEKIPLPLRVLKHKVKKQLFIFF
ncbi:hypothetical protein O181_131581, partial [Austropuccinia psidii MF-1]|nr:hypothetical protein [Austropuccinia psidii MF-1]